MDLRKYPVPQNITEVLNRQISEDRVTWYQPFIFSDDVVAGTAAVWNAKEDKYLCTAEDNEQTRDNFIRETTILGDWYEHLVDIMVAAFPKAQSFMDFGCNLGHFGLDLTPRGKSYSGIDVPRNEPGVRLLQDITGIDYESVAPIIVRKPHRIHDLDAERKFDVGIFSVVIMHLTDPHFALPYFASHLNEGMFFSSVLTPGDTHQFKARITRWNRGKMLPHTLELVPTEPLAESLMRFSGFPYIYKIPYREGIDPRHSKQWGCWVAARGEIPHEAIEGFDLKYVEDRTDDYADGAPDGTIRVRGSRK